MHPDGSCMLANPLTGECSPVAADCDLAFNDEGWAFVKDSTEEWKPASNLFNMVALQHPDKGKFFGNKLTNRTESLQESWKDRVLLSMALQVKDQDWRMACLKLNRAPLHGQRCFWPVRPWHELYEMR